MTTDDVPVFWVASVTVSRAVKTPGCVYVWTGLASVEFGVPSPKSHE